MLGCGGFEFPKERLPCVVWTLWSLFAQLSELLGLGPVFEFKLAIPVEDNQKGCFECVSSNRRIRGNVSPLLGEVGHVTNRDIDKAARFNATFASVFKSDDGPWDPWSPVLEEGNPEVPSNCEVV